MKNVRQMLSMVFLLASLGLFVAFHFLPWTSHNEEWGWHAWLELRDVIENPKSLDATDAVLIACFLNFSLLIVVSPFLKKVLSKSPWAWWGAVIFSGLAGVGFWAMYLIGVMHYGYDFKHQGVGLWCLQFAPVFNFIGLLLARRKFPESCVIAV